METTSDRNILLKDNNLGLDKTDLSVFTYNILSASSGNPKWFPSVNKNDLYWDTRKSRLITMISKHLADVVCLQEVDHYNFFQAELGKFGYASEYKIRPGKPDGCATFYKQDAYYLASKVDVEFNDVADQIQDPIEKTKARTSNIGLILFLTSIADSKTICVANCHLYWQGGADKLRLYQMRYFVMNIIKAKKSLGYYGNDDIPTIICGDFNASFTSEALTFLQSQNYVNSYYDVVSHLSLPTEFYSIYTLHYKETVDHITFNSSQCKVIGVWSLPTKDQLEKKAKSYPVEDNPSDHLPLLAFFCYNKN